MCADSVRARFTGRATSVMMVLQNENDDDHDKNGN